LNQEESVLHVVICDKCEERLEYKDYYSREHRQKYPNHDSYSIVFKSYDEYVKRIFGYTNKQH
jgi:hypothetical protein